MKTIATFVLLLLLCVPTRARAQDLPMGPQAHAHLQKGLEAYKAKDYLTAILEFQAGYALEPRKEFLFAWAQAERLHGNCSKAIDLYEQFIITGPSRAQQSAAQQNIDRCREALKVQPAPPGVDEDEDEDESSRISPVPVRKAAPPPPVAAQGAAGPRAWWTDGWGAGLVGAGVVSLGVGIGFSVAAGTSTDAADRAPTYDEYAARQDEAAGRRTVAAVAYGTGIGLVAAGAVRYYLVRGDRASGPREQIALDVSGDGATLWVAGAW